MTASISRETPGVITSQSLVIPHKKGIALVLIHTHAGADVIARFPPLKCWSIRIQVCRNGFIPQ